MRDYNWTYDISRMEYSVKSWDGQQGIIWILTKTSDQSKHLQQGLFCAEQGNFEIVGNGNVDISLVSLTLRSQLARGLHF